MDEWRELEPVWRAAFELAWQALRGRLRLHDLADERLDEVLPRVWDACADRAAD